MEFVWVEKWQSHSLWSCGAPLTTDSISFGISLFLFLLGGERGLGSLDLLKLNLETVKSLYIRD